MQINQWDNKDVKELITLPAECTKSISNLFSKNRRKKSNIEKRIFKCIITL